MRSMTGMGTGSCQVGAWVVSVTVATWNARGREVHLRLPEEFRFEESWLRERLGAVVARGRCEVRVAIEEGSEFVPDIDFGAVERWGLRLAELSRYPFLEPRLSLADLIALPGVIRPRQKPAEVESESRKALAGAFHAAVESLVVARSLEGQRLEQKFREMLAEVRAHGSELRGLAPQLSRELEQEVRGRLAAWSVEGDARFERVTEEVVKLMTRLDLREELDRIEVHVDQLESLLTRDEPVGRRLEFLAQELLREFHSLGSKLSHAEAVHRTFEARNLCEQIREQAANVE